MIEINSSSSPITSEKLDDPQITKSEQEPSDSSLKDFRRSFQKLTRAQPNPKKQEWCRKYHPEYRGDIEVIRTQKKSGGYHIGEE